MTAVVLFISLFDKTPYLMWMVAMVCDTILLTTHMILKAKGLA